MLDNSAWCSHAIMKIACNCSDVYLTPTLCNLENSRKFWIYGFGNSVCGFGKGGGHVYCKNCNFVVRLLSTILDKRNFMTFRRHRPSYFFIIEEIFS